MTPIIDAEGMFGGDRMAKLSDAAKLYWPWFYLASNGFARLEINYRRLGTRVFSGFIKPPTEEATVDLIREYSDAYLLFVYRVNGQLWGQWDTPAKCLPRHKTADDHRSPEPPEDEIAAWRAEYSATKCFDVRDLHTFAEKRQKAPRRAEIFVAAPKSAADFAAIPREEKRREVNRSEENKNICTSDDVPASVEPESFLEPDGAVWDEPAPEPKPKTKAELKAEFDAERERWFDEQFWPIVWAKIAVGAARKAWMSKITSEELRDKAIAAAKRQRQGILERGRRPGATILHPSTWLNQERWEDEAPMFADEPDPGLPPAYIGSWERDNA